MSFKRILSLVLVLCMVLSFFPASAFADNDAAEEEGIEEVVEEPAAEEPAPEEEAPAPAEEEQPAQTEEEQPAPAAAEVEEEIVEEEVVAEAQTVSEEAANDELDPAAKAGGKYWPTLQEAVNVGGTVEVLKITNEAVTITKDVTLTGGYMVYGAITVEEGAALTLNNISCGSITVGDGCALNVNQNNVTVTSASVVSPSAKVIAGVKAGTFFSSLDNKLLAYGFVRDTQTGVVSAVAGNPVAVIEDGERQYYYSFNEAVQAAGTTKAIILLSAPDYTFPNDTDTLKLVLNGYSAAGIKANKHLEYYVKGTAAEDFTVFSQVRFAATVDSVGYATFAEAVTAAGGTKTIVLNDNIAEAYTMSVGETLVVEKGSYALTVNAPEGYALNTAVVGEVTTYTVALAVAEINGVKYDTLAKAIAAAPTTGSATIKILVDEASTGSTDRNTAPSVEGKNVVLDLDGKTLYGAINVKNGGKLTIKNGTLSNEGGQGVNVHAMSGSTMFTLAEDATIVAEYGVILREAADSTSSTINIDGTVNGNVWVIGSINKGSNTINVNGSITSESNPGLALNGKCTVNVNDGAVITGTTGIENRGGNLNVKGGTITGTGVPASFTPNTNGTTSKGAGIAVSRYDINDTSTTITGGVIKGYTPLAVANTSGTDLKKVTVYINDGTFEAINGGPVAVSVAPSENVSKFIAGGIFSSPVEEAFCAETFIPEDNGDGTYGVKKGAYSYRVVAMPDTEPQSTYWTTSGQGYEEAQLDDAIAAALNESKKVLVLAGDNASVTFAANDKLRVYAVEPYKFTSAAAAGVTGVNSANVGYGVVEYTAGANYAAKVAVEGKPDQYFDSIGGAGGALATANKTKGATVSFLSQPTSGIKYTMAADVDKTLVIDWADYDSDAITVSAPEGFFRKVATEGTVTTYSLTAAVAKMGGYYFETFAEAAAAYDDTHSITLLAEVTDSYTMDPAKPRLHVNHDGHSLTVVAPDGYALKDNGTLVPETETRALVARVTNTSGSHVYTITQKFTYTFNPDNGGDPIVRTVYADTNLEAPPTVSKVGYNGRGWFDENGVEYPNDGTSKPSSDKTYTAEWNAKQYKLATYNYYGGPLLVKSRTVSYGEVITAPEKQPVNAGHTFLNWGLLNDRTLWEDDNPTFTRVDFPFTLDSTILGDTAEGGFVDIYAVWEVNVHAVSFDADGGTFKNSATGAIVSSIDNVDVETGKAIPHPANDPTKAGYNFLGWRYEGGIVETYSALPSTMPDESRSYVALWELINYPITYTGEVDEALPRSYNAEMLPLTIPEQVMDGYTFVGFTCPELGITDANPAKELVVPVGAHAGLNVTANWTPVQYNITYDLDGGNWADAETANYPSYNVNDIPFTIGNPIKDGSTFLGWTSATVTEPTNPFTVTAGTTGDLELTANWSVKPVNVTINYNDGGATKTDKYTVDFGTPINQPTIPDYEGHTFIGFFVDDNSGTPMEFPYSPATYPIDGVKIILGWNINKHSVTLNANAGKFASNGKDTLIYKDVAYSVELTPDSWEVPVLDGYTFKGWKLANDADVPATMPDADVEAVAVWEVKQVTVNVDYADTNTKNLSYKVDYGTDIEKPADVSVEGWTLTGWNWMNANGTVYQEDVEFPLVLDRYYENVNLKATWEKNEYTLTINTGDGAWPDGTTEGTRTLKFGDEIEPIGEPVLKGNDFIGWFQADGTKMPAAMPASNLVVTAKFAPHVYKITYNRTESAAKLVNPETGVTDQSNYQVEVAYGAEIPEAPVLIYAGHSYEWIEAKYGYNVPDTMPASDLTFNAKWEGINYVYTFDGNGGQIKDMHNDYVDLFYVVANYDDTTVINHVFAGKREGYTAHSWMTEEGKHIDALPSPLPAEDTTYTVVWDINKHDVTFAAGGGKFIHPVTGLEVDNAEITIKGVEFGADIPFPAGLERVGYTFNDWNEFIVPYGFEYPTEMPDSDLRFVADWTANQITVTFDGNGGLIKDTHNDFVASYSVTGTVEDALVFPAASKLEGYTGHAWADPDGKHLSVLPDKFPAEDTTYTLIWDINKYNVSFNAMNGTVVNPTTLEEVHTYTDKDVVYGTDLVYPEDPVREGYTFDGWFEVVDGYHNPITMPDRALFFYAQWKADEHTITLDANGGVFVNDLGEVSPTFEFTGKYGEAVTYPDNDTLRLEGYTFKGWVGPDGVIGHRPTTVPAEDVTYTALWEVNEYDVYFRPNNAYAFITNSVNAQTIGQGQILNLKVKYGEEIPYPEIEAAGFEFECWVEDRTGYDVPVTMPAYAVGLTAKWKGVDFTVTFDGNGGLLQTKALDIDPANTTHVDWVESYTVMGARLISAEQNLQALLPTYAVRPGFAFHGFVDQNGRHYDPGQLPTSFGPEDMTFKAEWVRLSYNATFNSMGGALVDPNKNLPAPNGVFTEEVLFEDPILFPEDPVMKGYTFDGWAEVLNGYGRNYPDTMPVPSNAAGLVFEAQWKINEYSYTFDADGGIMETTALDGTTHVDKIGVYTITGKFGEDLKKPTNVTKTGYSFHGWVDQDGKHYGTVADITDTIPAKDMIFTAVWEINSYWVTFDAINGRTYAANAKLMNPNTGLIETDGRYEQKVVFGTEIPFPADPVLKGYTFVGWAEVQDKYGYNHPETMPVPKTDYGLVFEAQWVPEEHTITFDANGGEITSPDGRIQYSNPYSFTLPTDKAIDENVYYNFVARLEGYNIQYWLGSDGKIYGKNHFTLPATMPAEDLTLTAVWDIQEYYVYFVPRGGQVTDPITLVKQPTDVNVRVLVKYGDPIPYAEVERKGYEFDTWVEDYYGKVLPETAPALPNGRDGLYFRAAWKGLDYTVTFDGNGGTIETTALDGSTANPQTHKDYVESYTVIGNFGDAIKSPTFVGRDGYTFHGWVDQNGKHYNFGQTPATFPAEDMVFTAQWTPLEQNVTFNANNGMVVNPFTGVIVPTFEYKVKSDEAITYPADPVRTGYEFKGWQEDGDLKLGFLHPENMPAKGKDLVFYAQWAPIPNTVVYDANGGTVLNKAAEPVEILTIEAKTGEAIYVPTEKPVRYGYDFSAWLDSKDNWLAPGSTAATMPAEGETYTARWEAKTIKVNYYYNVGTNAALYTSDDVKFGQLINPPMDPVITGLKFEGWYTFNHNDGRLIEEFNFSNPVDTEDPIDLVAKWSTAMYTVHFDVNGGRNTVPDQIVEHGKTATKPLDRNMYRNGYDFRFWVVRNENGTLGTEPYDFSTPVTKDLELVALWAGKEVTIRWADRNVYFEDQKVHVGDFIVRPEFDSYYFQQMIQDGIPGYRLDPEHLWYPEPPENVEEALAGMMYTLNWIKLNQIFVYNEKGQLRSVEVDDGMTLGEAIEAGIITAPDKPGYKTVWLSNGEPVDESEVITEGMVLAVSYVQAKTVKFVNYDGSELSSAQYEIGETPVYTGTPERPAEPGITYIFKGWDPEIVPVEADATYVATYTEKRDELTVTFISEGDVYKEAKVDYGMKVEKPADPKSKLVGNKFSAWYEKDSTTPFDFNSAILANTILEAAYEPVINEPVFRTTLSMEDYTGINVLITLPDGENAADYTVKTEPQKTMYPYDGKEVSLGGIKPNADGEYRIADVMKAASTEMTDIVKVTLLKKGEVVKTEEYSVYSIVKERLESGELDEARDRLNRALLQYGRLAQIRFEHKMDDMPEVTGAPALTLIPDSFAAKGDPTDFGKYISKFEAKIEMADAVRMNIYLTPAEGYSLDDFDISVVSAGAPRAKVSTPEMKGGKISVQVSGILSYEMDQDVQITVKLKSTGASATWTRSLITCAYENYQAATTDERRNLMMGLYQYFLAAYHRFVG